MNSKILKRLIEEECWMTCLTLACVFLMIWCKTPCMQVPVPLPEGMTIFINEVIFGLCMSIIAGIIVYVLTSLVPKAEKMEPILKILIKRLRYAKDTLESSLKSISKVGCVEEVTTETVVDRLSLKDIELPSGIRVLKVNLKYIREELLDYVDFVLQYVYSRIDYLDNENSEGIGCIMDKTLELRAFMDEIFEPFEREKTKIESTEVIDVGKEQLTRIAEGLIELHAQTKKMYEKIGELVEERR